MALTYGDSDRVVRPEGRRESIHGGSTAASDLQGSTNAVIAAHKGMVMQQMPMCRTTRTAMKPTMILKVSTIRVKAYKNYTTKQLSTTSSNSIPPR